MAMTVIKFLVFTALLVYASVSDIKKREVSDSVPVMIAITALIGITPGHLPGMFIAAAVVTLPQLIVAMIKPNSYGGADIKIMASSAFLLGLGRGVAAMIIGLSAGLLITTITRFIQKKKITKESFPVVPYLAAGSLIAFLI